MLHERNWWSVRALMAKAMAAGAARPSMGHFEWDMSGDCESAKRMEYFARPPAPFVKGHIESGRFIRSNKPWSTWVQPRDVIIDSKYGQREHVRRQIEAFGFMGPASWQATRSTPAYTGSLAAIADTDELTRGGRTSLWVTQIVRCGKCAACLRVRRRKWVTRMHIECKRSYRVWTGNIQLRPEQHYKVRLEAAYRYDNDKKYPNRKAGGYDALPQAVQFACCHRIISKEITRWIKRIRHTTKSGVRICVVSEVHEGGGRNHGLPHYHVLIHQTEEAQITKAVLENRWTWGFSHWRLVEEKDVNRSVGYLCKYLSKSMASRIRASLGYGKVVLGHSEVVSQTNVKTNDPPNFHCLKASGSERQENTGCTDPSGTAAVGLEGQLHRYWATVDDCRAAADARLGGPGRTEAFKKLAAKGYVRRDPALVHASKVTHASLGHGLSPTGPFDYPSASEGSDGPLSACLLAGQSSGSDEIPEE